MTSGGIATPAPDARSASRSPPADGLIAVTPVFSASYSGLFKMFFDALDTDALNGMPVLIAATAGTRPPLAGARPRDAAAVQLPARRRAPDRRLRRDRGLRRHRDLDERITRAAAELANAVVVSGSDHVAGFAPAPDRASAAYVRERPGARRRLRRPAARPRRLMPGRDDRSRPTTPRDRDGVPGPRRHRRGMSDDKKITVERTIQAPTWPSSRAATRAARADRRPASQGRPGPTASSRSATCSHGQTGDHLELDYHADEPVTGYSPSQRSPQTARAGQEPPGWQRVGDLEAEVPTTQVRHTYDWSKSARTVDKAPACRRPARDRAEYLDQAVTGRGDRTSHPE